MDLSIALRISNVKTSKGPGYLLTYLLTEQNKTISDGGITVYFWIVKVQTSNRSSNSWGSLNSWGSSNNWDPQIVGDHLVPLDH